MSTPEYLRLEGIISLYGGAVSHNLERVIFTRIQSHPLTPLSSSPTKSRVDICKFSTGWCSAYAAEILTPLRRIYCRYVPIFISRTQSGLIEKFSRLPFFSPLQCENSSHSFLSSFFFVFFLYGFSIGYLFVCFSLSPVL